MLRFYTIVCKGLAILYVRVVFICFIGFLNMVFSGKRTLKNIDGGRAGPEEKIKDMSYVLVKRRQAFLDQATISTEITAFQILDDVANISTQLQYLSSQVSDAGRWSMIVSGSLIRWLSYCRTRCKNQRNPMRMRLPVYSQQGLSHGNTRGIPGLHCQLGE